MAATSATSSLLVALAVEQILFKLVPALPFDLTEVSQSSVACVLKLRFCQLCSGCMLGNLVRVTVILPRFYNHVGRPIERQLLQGHAKCQS